MSTPEFILELRERIDHMPLWLIGVTGYVRRDDGLILLEQRADNGKWTLVTGINEPGEEPADTVVREAKEETGVDVIVTDLVSVKSDHEIKSKLARAHRLCATVPEAPRGRQRARAVRVPQRHRASVTRPAVRASTDGRCAHSLFPCLPRAGLANARLRALKMGLGSAETPPHALHA